jgi:hypothetical protein
VLNIQPVVPIDVRRLVGRLALDHARRLLTRSWLRSPR